MAILQRRLLLAPEELGRAQLQRVARAVKTSPKTIRGRLVLCGQEGSTPGTCWNGSPYQPVPIP